MHFIKGAICLIPLLLIAESHSKRIHFANRFVLLFLFLLINLRFFSTFVCGCFARIIVLIIFVNHDLSWNFIKILIGIRLIGILKFIEMLISLLVKL